MFDTDKMEAYVILRCFLEINKENKLSLSNALETTKVVEGAWKEERNVNVYKYTFTSMIDGSPSFRMEVRTPSHENDDGSVLLFVVHDNGSEEVIFYTPDSSELDVQSALCCMVEELLVAKSMRGDGN